MTTGCSEGTGKEGRAETCCLHQDMDSVKSSLKNKLEASGEESENKATKGVL